MGKNRESLDDGSASQTSKHCGFERFSRFGRFGRFGR